jgi:hypothetical protein
MNPCEYVKPWPLDDTIIKAYHLMATGQTADAMEVLKPLFQDALYRKDLAALNQPSETWDVYCGGRLIESHELNPVQNGAESARFSESRDTNVLNFVRSSEFAKGVENSRKPFKSAYMGIKRKAFQELAAEFMLANGLRSISALALYLNLPSGSLNHLMLGASHGTSKSRWAMYLSQHLSPEILADQPKRSINEAS